MTEEQQELYDIVSDWWDDVFCAASYKGKDASLVDLVLAISEWRNRDEYVEDPWNLQPRQPMQKVWKSSETT